MWPGQSDECLLNQRDSQYRFTTAGKTKAAVLVKKIAPLFGKGHTPNREICIFARKHTHTSMHTNSCMHTLSHMNGYMHFHMHTHIGAHKRALMCVRGRNHTLTHTLAWLQVRRCTSRRTRWEARNRSCRRRSHHMTSLYTRVYAFTHIPARRRART